MKGPLSWSPVLSPEEGHWRVGVDNVTIGNTVIDVCATGNCSAIVDTGSSLLGVPRATMKSIFKETLRIVPGARSVEGIDCRNVPGTPIVFHMAGGFEITLGADGYSRPGPGTMRRPDGDQIVCQSIVLPVDIMETPVFVFGEPVLQRYYTSFDADQRRIGFALARHESEEIEVV